VSSEEPSEEVKTVILKLLKTAEELKMSIGPLIKDQNYAQKALEVHESTLRELMDATVTLKGSQETIQKDLAKIKDYTVDPTLFKELEGRIRKLENVFLSQVVEKVGRAEKVPESEFKEFKAIAEKQDDSDLWITLGLIYHQRNQNQEALERFEKAIRSEEKNVHAWCLKAEMLQVVGKHEEALKVFDKAGELSKCPVILRHQAYSTAVLGKKEQALDLIDRAIQGDETDAVSWALKGRILTELDRTTEALGCLEKALELKPNLAVALEDKAIILSGLGPNYYEEALNCFEKATQADPNSTEVWFNKGLALQQLHRDEESIKSFDRAIVLDPKNSCAYCARGMSKSNLGNPLDALEDLNKALKIGLQEECHLFYSCRASVLQLLKRDEEALEDLTKALSIEPGSTYSLLMKASLLARSNKPDEARKCVESVIQSQPTDSRHLNALAYTLYELGEPERALDFAKKALEKEPDRVIYIDTLACILSRLGQNQDSLQLFERALKLRKNDGQITWSELADVYEKSGREEEAKGVREKHVK